MLAAPSPDAETDEGASWFPVDETHPIRLSPRSRVVLHSAGLGWRHVFASVTSGRVWSARVPAIEHASLAYCLRGANSVERAIEGGAREVVDFRPRQFGILPTHAPATFNVTGGADVMLVYLRGSMMRRVADEMFGLREAPIHLRPTMGFLDPLLEQLVLAILAALNRQDPLRDRRYVDQLAVTAAAHCIQNYLLSEPSAGCENMGAPAPSLTASVHRACMFIDAHLDSDLSLDKLAREAKTTPAVLTQAFAQIHGLTPHQYVIGRRLEHARRLLIGTSLPLAEIALRTGFASQSHFSAVFKRVTSETPNGFRRAR